MTTDDLHDRTTPPPPSPSAARLFAPAVDSRRIQESQERILEALRSGVVSLVNRFFGDAREVVRQALLHASYDFYNDGVARGRAQARLVCGAYVDAMQRAYLARVYDARAEPAPPAVKLAALHAIVARRGVDLSAAELAKLCAELQLVLAPDAS